MPFGHDYQVVGIIVSHQKVAMNLFASGEKVVVIKLVVNVKALTSLFSCSSVRRVDKERC